VTFQLRVTRLLKRADLCSLLKSLVVKYEFEDTCCVTQQEAVERIPAEFEVVRLGVPGRRLYVYV